MHLKNKKLLVTTQAVDKDDPILGFFHGWLLEFARHFGEVHVICLRKGRYEFPPHVHVHSLGKEEGENRFKYTLRFYRHFFRIFFKHKVDYVFFHMGAIYNILAAPFFCVRSFLGTKFYWWKAHGHINAMGRFAMLFVDNVYTSTRTGFPIETKKRRIIGQAIDPSKFEFTARTRKDEIIFVGRVKPIKRIEDFIETAYLLKDQFPLMKWNIIGPVDDEGYKARLERSIQEKGLTDHVFFIGSRTQDEMVSVYQSANIFLNTSRTESMDKTVLEAALAGCIPVTSNSAFEELLSDDVLYLKEGTPSRYAARIEELLSEDVSELRARLRNRVIQKHSITTFTQRIFHD